jgi:hypothetical protein
VTKSSASSASSVSHSHTRASNGLDQFFSAIADQANLRILDLAGASQAIVSFITSLGHRLYSDDIVRTMDDAFGRDGEFLANQSDPSRAEQFLRQTLDFPEGQFDGALVWDTLQFLAPPLLQLTIQRLYRILRPQAALLAFFHAEEKAKVVPVYSYRIVDAKVISLAPRGERKPAQFFNNRSLEKLFQEFHSVKFFLARDHLREVIVKR